MTGSAPQVRPEHPASPGYPASAEPPVTHGHPDGTGHPAGSASLASHAVPECSGDTCITCSDSAVTVTVLWLMGDDLAMVDTGAGQEVVSVGLVEAKAGDQILVHAKEAIAVIGS